jgi:3-oxoacyl-[acyl-carrier protein] reductase
MRRKSVLITGGSRGIGRVTAMHLLMEGWNVAITYSSSADAAAAFEQEAKATLSKDRADVIALRADVRDHVRSREVVDIVAHKFAGLDALVNNAGIRRDALLYNMTDDQWREVVDINLDGTWGMTKAAVPVMMQQRSGAIVNVASLSGLHGVAGQTNYSAAKGALIAMTRSLSREVARAGIRVNCVAPGLIETDMTSDIDPEARKELIRQIPMRRIIRADEVAAGISFLLSDDASAITGQVLCIDGGASA